MPGQRITQLPPIPNILPTDFFIAARGSTTFKVPGSLLGTKADVMALSATFPALAQRTDLSLVSSSVVQLSTLTTQALQTVATKIELNTQIVSISAQVDTRYALKTELQPYILKPITDTKPFGTVLMWDGTGWIAGDTLTALSGVRTMDVAPVGSIIWFSTPAAPNGYFFCDGRALNVGLYPELFAVLGYRYGGSGATFNIPDLRGEFIRGWAGTRGVDTGRAFGSVQADLFKAHSHSYTSPLANGNATRSSKGRDNITASTYNTSVEGGNETRPRNIALLPCIKYSQLIATATLANTLSSYIPIPAGASVNQFLSYNGTQWVGSNPLSLLPAGSQGQVLTWNNGSWTAGQGITASINESTAFVLTNQDTISWNQIPATAKRLTLVISGLTIGSESINTIQLKVGTASGIVASGYQGVSTVSYLPSIAIGGGVDLYNSGIGTTSFPLMIQIPKSTFASLFGGTNNRALQTGLDTIITLMKSGTNRWVMSHSGRLGLMSSTQGGGSVTLSNPLTQVELTTNNTSIKMTSGNVLLYVE